MNSKKSVYELAYNRCMKKGIIQKSCDKFLKLDFELKLKKCKTSKCKKFYKSKIKSLKRKSYKRRKSSKKKSPKRSLKKKRSSDGFTVDFPVKPYNTCYVWKGF